MCACFIGLHYYTSVAGVAQGMPSSSVGKVFGHQWLSRWLTSCSRGARLSRDKQLTEVVSL